MHSKLVLVCLFLVGLTLFGQVGSGTITGTVIDQNGAVVASATVEARNTETGVVFRGVSTNTGDYTIPDLPVGTYVVTLKVQGFKVYTHENLAMRATQVLLENIALQVGTATESVTVTAESTLLSTQTGELAHYVTLKEIDDLPLLGIGTANAGVAGVRNPFNVIESLPGMSSYVADYGMTFNGLSASQSIRIEGQDATQHILPAYSASAQPGADAIQEVAFQTSNYAPEFGTVGSVMMNFNMKSGTNQYHGTGYDYFVNEFLNAGNPFTVNASGVGKLRPVNRRNDFGGTLGGPIYIPKIYDGRNKTFFFFNYEEYLETTTYSFTDTVPAAAYLNGDFSAISPTGTCSLCATYGIPTTPLGGTQLDPLGNQLFANTIYDPATRNVATSGPLAGQAYALPFPGNKIDPVRFDQTTKNFLALLQTTGVKAQNSNLTGNYAGIIPGQRYSDIPSFKIDHNISAKDKVSFYYQKTNTETTLSTGLGGADGLPLEIGGYRGTFYNTQVERLNYDRTLTPTLLLHIGAGMYYSLFNDKAPFTSFDPTSFGLTGFVQQRQFPSITGTSSALYGGMQNMGTSGQIQSQWHEIKPTFNSNATWVRGKHTYKLGAEMYLQGTPEISYSGVTLATGTNATSAPFTPANSLGGFSTGFGFASWLLGDYNSTSQTPQYDKRLGYQQWAIYLQDSWKVTRKLTVDYGLRWDLATTPHEQYGRLGQFDMTTPNANAGGRPGATLYANTCNCQFYQPTYPYAIGPRIGIAYQINSKTVLRGGWGVVFSPVASVSAANWAAGAVVGSAGTYSVAANSPSYVPAGAQFVNIEAPGAISSPVWPVTDPNIYPNLGTTAPKPFMPDANQNRPPRINQWSIGIQREITKNFLMEASYVANRAVWLTGALGELSQISPQQYAAYGLFPYPGTGPCATGGGVCASTAYDNNADRNLLSQSISNPAVIKNEATHGITNLVPYAGFPTSTTLQNSIVPFPQFGAIGPTGSATGDSRYDSLQMKTTKRFSHGLQAGGAYTWAKGFTLANRQDFFNPASSAWALQQIPPQTLTFNFTYTVPKAAFLNKIENAITEGWQIGGYALYQSGQFLTPPASPTANFLASQDVRVASQPLYNVDINNIHSYNPYLQQVLNPLAWTPCPTNTTCTATGTLNSNFRGPRHPTENANFSRNFRIKERMSLQIRAEFVNIFNRTLMPNPATTNPQNAATKNNLGIYTAGYGVINAYATPGTLTTGSAVPTAVSSGLGTPLLTGRTGTLIARFTF
jgi:hypothetical protein